MGKVLARDSSILATGEARTAGVATNNESQRRSKEQHLGRKQRSGDSGRRSGDADSCLSPMLEEWDHY